MADPLSSQGISDSTSTVTVVASDNQVDGVPTLRLRLKKPKNDKKVKWTNETVDNEDMNKKKSKCCCIYNKPRKFDESSSEDSDDECDHCHGHVEKKRHKHAANPLGEIDSVPNPNDSETNPNPESAPSS